MSKIIIHVETPDSVSHRLATKLVEKVIESGFQSGERQYTWLTHFRLLNIEVHAKKTRGNTHTFKVRRL